MKEFYLYSEKNIFKTIKEMFVGFEIHIVSREKILKNNFINQNIFLVTEGLVLEQLKKSFFLDNNIVIFYTKSKSINKNNFVNAKFFNKLISVNKFIDEVTTSFVSNSFNYGDIKILGDKLINNKTEKEILLTSLEKNILILLIDKEKIEKNVLLEIGLNIKKDTETKTLESHLTRIRNKLSKINSNLKILSKEKNIFLTT